MKRKRSFLSVAIEAAIVLLITIIAFRWGQRVAFAERGYTAYGGEFLLLLIPPMYYSVKRTILDWIADIRKYLKGGYDR